MYEHIPFCEDTLVQVTFNGHRMGDCPTKCFILDSRVLIMIDALTDRFMAARIAVVRSYLPHLHLRWGLLANFGKKELTVTGVAPQVRQGHC
jgi:hypothetical protein